MKTNIFLKLDYATRRKRRAAVKDILAALITIRDLEQNSLDNVPDNLQCTESYDAGEFAVETLDDVIELLGCVY